MMQDVNTNIVTAAKEWASAKVCFRHRGISRSGCDCSGFFVGILKELGYIPKYRLRDYAEDFNLHNGADEYLTECLLQLCDTINKKQLVPGNIITFKYGRCVSHLGIIIKPPIFAHAYKWAGRVALSSIQSGEFKKRLAGCYQINMDKMAVYNG